MKNPENQRTRAETVWSEVHTGSSGRKKPERWVRWAKGQAQNAGFGAGQSPPREAQASLGDESSKKRC